MIHSADTVCALSGNLVFSVNTSPADAPLIVFAIKEHSKLMSVLGRKNTILT